MEVSGGESKVPVAGEHDHSALKEAVHEVECEIETSLFSLNPRS